MRLFFLLAVLSAPLWAQTPHEKLVNVSGKVVGPDGKAVPGAEILLDEGKLLRADANGRFVARVKPRWGDYLGRVIARAPEKALAGAVLQKSGTTIRLQPAITARGRVVDEKENPVANTVVQLSYSKILPDGLAIILSDSPWRNDYRTRTDARGNWELRGLPEGAQLGLQLDDARFVSTPQTLIASNESTKATLIARRGASLQGRLIYADGHPAKGFPVSAQGQNFINGWGEATSDAEGRFVIHGLPDGAYNVMLRDPKKQWVSEAIEGALAKAGKTQRLRDMVLTAGVILKGRVVDSATGKGIAGAMIGSYSTQNPQSSAAAVSADSDAQGRFQLRVPLGKAYVYVMGSPPGYENKQISHNLVADEKSDEIILKLQRAAQLRGVAVDEKNKPLGGVLLQFVADDKQAHHDVPETKTDSQGNFSIDNLNAGLIQIKADGPWQVIAPIQATATVGDNAALRVVLKARSWRLRTVRGTVITTDGKAVPGAEITATVFRALPGGYGTSQQEKLTSDKQGYFSRGGVRPDETVTLSVSKPGYRFVKGGALSAKNDILVASPAILAPLNGRISGQVLGSDGKAAGNAWILALEGDGKLQRANAQGRFSLQNLPVGSVTVLAAQGHNVMRVVAKTGGQIKLKLAPMAPPRQDIERGAQILENLARNATNKNYYAVQLLPAELAPFDLPRAQQLARLIAGKGGADIENSLIALSPEDQKHSALQGAPQLLAMKPSYEKYYMILPVLSELEKTKPGVSQQLFEEAKTWLATKANATKAIATKANAQSEADRMEAIFGGAIVAALAARNGSAQTPEWTKKALDAAREVEANSKDQQRGLVSAIIEGWASWAPELVEVALPQLSIGAQADSLARAIAELSPRDLPRARRLLEQLSALPVAGAEDRGNSLNRDSEWAFGLAAKSVIQHMGATDPAGALALARRVKSSYHRADALAKAAQFQPRSDALKLLREAADLSVGKQNEVDFLARLGAQAYDFDAVTARELWERALTALRRPDFHGNGGLSNIAFYMARDDAARARLLLESAFARVRVQPGASPWQLSSYAQAMAAIDTERALQFADLIPPSSANGSEIMARFDVRRKIAQYILALDNVRRTLRFDRWGASDTWRPGTPTHW